MQIKAAVTNSKSEDFKIETITLDDPKDGEVLIRLVASGYMPYRYGSPRSGISRSASCCFRT